MSAGLAPPNRRSFSKTSMLMFARLRASGRKSEHHDDPAFDAVDEPETDATAPELILPLQTARTALREAMLRRNVAATQL
jgi:hypothetical protein